MWNIKTFVKKMNVWLYKKMNELLLIIHFAKEQNNKCFGHKHGQGAYEHTVFHKL